MWLIEGQQVICKQFAYLLLVSKVGQRQPQREIGYPELRF